MRDDGSLDAMAMPIGPRSRMKELAAGLVLACGVLAAPALYAEPASGDAAADNAAADRLYEEGRVLSKNGRDAEACQRYAQSDALKRTFGTAVNLGNCARNTGRPGRAWQLYDDAIHAAERDGTPKLVEFSRDLAAAVAPELCSVVVKMTSVAPAAIMVRVAGHTVTPDADLGGWTALVEPGEAEVEITGSAVGLPVKRTVRCLNAGDVATFEVGGADPGNRGVPGVQRVAPVEPSDAERWAIEASLGLGFFPQQRIGASLAFNATLEGWRWQDFAIGLRGAGAVFLHDDDASQRQPGIIGFLGPAAQYALVPQLWIGGGAGVAAGVWDTAMGTDQALRPGFEFGASYWFAGSFNVSIEGLGFIDRGAGLGPISLLMGAKLR
jgi:hypothetical protein